MWILSGIITRNIWIIEGRFGRETSAKYFLTSLGAKAYNNITILEDALNIIWKLNAVDAPIPSCKPTEDEISYIVDCLINIDEIKAILK